MSDDTQAAQQAQFAKLPRVVQDAIVSADVEKEMRALATTHKLHIDQWERLEREVMMTLLGLKPIDRLQDNIAHNVGVTAEVASVLMADIMRIVFFPIREELERELGHPEAHGETLNEVEQVREQVLANADTRTPPPATAPVPLQQSQQAVPPPAPVPATPPQSAPTEKVVRAPASGAYKPGETSIERRDIHDDPYRESPA